jgi:integrase
LSEPAIRILSALPRVKDSDFVFSTTGKTSVSGFSRAKRHLDQAIAKLQESGDTPIAPWVLHDLRRTAATGLQRLGVRLEVTEAVLNHVSGSRAGVVGIYQRYTWADEKRMALCGWGAHLMALVSGEAADNVIPLRPLATGPA